MLQEDGCNLDQADDNGRSRSTTVPLVTSTQELVTIRENGHQENSGS